MATLGQRLRYRWLNKDRAEGLRVTSSGSAYLAKAGSLDEFLTARYWGYNGQSGGRVRTYRITRDTWSLVPVIDYALDCDAGSLCGAPFGNAMSEPPASVLLATGSHARGPLAVHPNHKAGGNAADRVEIVEYRLLECTNTGRSHEPWSDKEESEW